MDMNSATATEISTQGEPINGERAWGRGDGSNILAPETMLPSQISSSADSLSMRAGVKGLMLAVLEDAIYCLADVSSGCSKRRHEARMAEGWIRERGEEWLFSFDSICRTLDLEPEDLRFRLLSVPLESSLPGHARRRRSHRVERGKRKRRSPKAKVSDQPSLAADECGRGSGEESLQQVAH